MSKYTTDVRFVCETYAGLTDSDGYDKINDVIEKSREKVFDFDFPIYDETYRSVLETKILKRYYTREIGFETVGLWKHFLDMRLNEIMPYYNELYKSALLEFNPFYDTDITTDSNRGIKHDETTSKDVSSSESENRSSTDNEEVSGNTTGKSTYEDLRTDALGHTINNTNTSSDSSTGTTTDNYTDKYSDTPQGGLQDVANGTYLTNARITSNLNNTNTSSDGTSTLKGVSSDTGTQKHEGSNDNSGTSHSNSTKTSGSDSSKTGTTDEDGTRKFTNTDDYLEHVRGKRGVDSYAKLLQEYRKTFLNIDVMIIDELGDLFMNLW